MKTKTLNISGYSIDIKTDSKIISVEKENQSGVYIVTRHQNGLIDRDYLPLDNCNSDDFIYEFNKQIMFLCGDIERTKIVNGVELDNHINPIKRLTAEEYLLSKDINLKSTALLTIIDGYMRQPNLLLLLEEYADLRIKELDIKIS